MYICSFFWCRFHSRWVPFLSVKPIFHCGAKPFALGPGIGLDPQHHNFALPIPTCWYLKTLKFALPPTQIITFALPPMQTPNASKWNIVCVQFPGIGSHVGHVHFILFASISFALGSQCPVEYGLNMGKRQTFQCNVSIIQTSTNS